MSNPVTLARPYAKAIFLKACEQKAIDFWFETVRKLGGILLNKQLFSLVTNPLVSNKEKVEVVLSVCGGDNSNNEIKILLKTLSDKNRLILLPDIFTLFDNYKKNYENKKEVEVISAFPLTEQDKSNFVTALEKRFKSKVTLKTKEDCSVIGGAIIKVDDTIIDGSVIGKLKQLKEQMLA